MFQVVAENASGIVLDVLTELCREPPETTNDSDQQILWDAVGPRGMGTREIRNVLYRLEDPSKCATYLPGRNLNYSFMVAEFVWIYLGRKDVEMIKHYNPNIEAYSDDGDEFFGAYGPRWRGQIGGCIERLRKDPDSRQAVLAIWRQQYNRERHVSPDAPYMTSKDVPCTLVMQYMIRKGKLEATVCMRSSDAFLGLPYDLFNFAMLQRSVAAELQLEVGPLSLFIGSSHLYDRDLEKAKVIVERWNDEHASYPPAYRLVMPPVPRVYELGGVAETEEWLRDPDRSTMGPICNSVWQPWFTMLNHRVHKDTNFVHESLRPLVQPYGFTP